MTTIEINGTTYNLKYSIRAYIYFEQIVGKPFSVSNLTDTYILFYSFLMASNKDTFKMTFDDFIDALDEDRSLMPKFNEFFKEESEKQAMITKDDGKKSKSKKA